MLRIAKIKSQEITLNISDYSEFKSKIGKGGFFNAHWCGKIECEEKIKEETGADIRVIPFGSENTRWKVYLLSRAKYCNSNFCKRILKNDNIYRCKRKKPIVRINSMKREKEHWS